MNIDTKKVAGFMGDFRTIWLGGLMLVAGAAWAGDLRWMTVADASKIAVQVEISSLQQKVEELEIQKVYESDPQKLKMMDALINITKSKIDTKIKINSVK